MAFSHLFTAALLAALILTHKVDADTCNNPGNTCDNFCNEVGLCLENYQWVSYENCQESSKVCLEGTCVTSAEYVRPCNLDDKYFCPRDEEMTIPSLEDCTSYYICPQGGGDVEPTKCFGRAWDACTGECTGSLTNGECPTSSTPCRNAGEVGIAPGYDRQYYVCQIVQGTLQPVWRTCTEGYRYSLTSRRCEQVGTTSQCTVCENASRVPGPIPHYGNSCSFLYCYTRTNFELVTCRSGWHYDHSQGGCIHGAC